MADRLSDMITRIKNGQMRGRLVVEVLQSKFCEEVLDCLVKEGFIRGYVLKGRVIEVQLKYKYGKPLLKEISRVSKPGFRCYYSAQKLREAFFKNDLIVFTSSSGIYLNSSLVLGKKNLGGEPLIRIR